MTDKEMLIKRLDNVGFTPVQEARRIGPRQYIATPSTVTIGEGENGYGGFFCEFIFDGAGKFIEHGCYE